jgi:hypothetical protein
MDAKYNTQSTKGENEMTNSIITKVVEQMNNLPDDLQQEVLSFVIGLRQNHSQQPVSSAWDVLDSLTGTIEAPADWSSEHDHYLYGTPKRQESNS